MDWIASGDYLCMSHRMTLLEDVSIISVSEQKWPVQIPDQLSSGMAITMDRPRLTVISSRSQRLVRQLRIEAALPVSETEVHNGT